MGFWGHFSLRNRVYNYRVLSMLGNTQRLQSPNVLHYGTSGKIYRFSIRAPVAPGHCARPEAESNRQAQMPQGHNHHFPQRVEGARKGLRLNGTGWSGRPVGGDPKG